MPVVVVRLPLALAGDMTIALGDTVLLQSPGRDIARDRGLRKGFGTVTGIVIETAIAIAIGVVTVPNLPGTMHVARAVDTIDADRDRLRGNAADHALEREGRGPNQEAKLVPVTIAGIDRLR